MLFISLIPSMMEHAVNTDQNGGNNKEREHGVFCSLLKSG